MHRHVFRNVVAGLVAIVIGLLIWDLWPDHHKPVVHKATCWSPEYAKHHTLHNTKTFGNIGHDLVIGSRHGAGSVVGICG